MMTIPASTGWWCPVHRNRVEDHGDVLVCPAEKRFPCVNGIPRFVRMTHYADAFGIQWNRYKRTQLDSYTGSTMSRDRAARSRRRTVVSTGGEQVLECGC